MSLSDGCNRIFSRSILQQQNRKLDIDQFYNVYEALRASNKLTNQSAYYS